MNLFISLFWGCFYLIVGIGPTEPVKGNDLMCLMLTITLSYGWCLFVDWRSERKRRLVGTPD